MTTDPSSAVPATQSTFSQLGLSPLLCSAAEKAGFKRPTAVQQAAVPALLEGRDVLLPTQTGSGKTAAFVLPALQLLADTAQEQAGSYRPPRVLILVPTRDLAMQTATLCRQLGRQLPIRTRVLCGGMDRALQCRSLQEGVDIVVGTHGRLLDLAHEGALDLSEISYLVLDEADRLLDEEFTEAMTALARYFPDHPQTVFCSATLSDDVMGFARKVTRDPVAIEGTDETVTPKRLRQRAVFVAESDKAALVEKIFRERSPSSQSPGRPAKEHRKAGPDGTDDRGRCIVFTRTKKEADTLARRLGQLGQTAMALHGGLGQGERRKVLERFKDTPEAVLVTTDIAARGLDIDDVTLVLNVDMPSTPETYIHRIGRTARAGQKGRTLSLVTPEERGLLRDVERHIQHRIRIVTPETLHD
ncbi:DEAD/DEAH box helicase [Oecophyllibacter saccharovorans]|uniref:DEAD/DEAH box helicase n=1 Tax=Oecophyllibacter saccharovorans TaxID=2558360 RepID=A0A506UQG3_9PROT|nr:DEAD/DEAH box helicase [Oecophyllibacter saccharovorans]TPW35587.1 DEAD/DEAH box helicase [Oecophyllibacter saccharovorans]